MLREKIGDKKFYFMVLKLTIPIMIQNGITNFVSLLDNIMVGKVGTEEMSGVAIVNQLMFIFMLCIFGAVSGAGIFSAQYFGQGNHEGVRHTFRFKLIIVLVVTAIFSCFMIWGGDWFIARYLHEGSQEGDLVATANFAKKYLFICLFELIPFAVMQVYVSTLRESGETFVPMIAGLTAVFVNLFFNYVLIFGNFGAPKLGVEGAAIATLISRIVEILIVVVWTHRHRERNKFIVGIYKGFYIPKKLAMRILVKGFPLLINEGLWAAGQAVLIQCYSVRGIAIVAGMNISSTIANLFNIVFIAMGSTISIVVGQQLGAGKMKEARTSAYRMTGFSVISCIGVSIIMITVGRFFPMIYNVSAEVKGIAVSIIVLSACTMPMQAYLHATYFTIRSGGKTFITFLFDSVFVWVITIPLAYILSKYTSLPVAPMFLIVQLADSIKCIIGFFMVRSGMWQHNIVNT